MKYRIKVELKAELKAKTSMYHCSKATKERNVKGRSDRNNRIDRKRNRQRGKKLQQHKAMVLNKVK